MSTARERRVIIHSRGAKGALGHQDHWAGKPSKLWDIAATIAST